jgi:hypothetical protein
MIEKNYTALDVIQKEYGDSRNAITPSRIEVGFTDSRDYAWELSTGRGLNHEWIYGVTVVLCETGPNGTLLRTKRKPELSDCFRSRRAAEQYIECLE